MKPRTVWTQRNSDHTIDRPKDEDQAWALWARQNPSEAKDYAALVLGKDLDGREQINKDDE
jgi:hypothetical protein